MKKEFTAIKTYINSQLVFIPENHTDIDELNKFPNGEILRVTARTIPDNMRRSLRQLDLYCAGCGVVAENTEHPDWNTKDKVDDQCRIKSEWIDRDSIKWVETVVDGKTFRFKHFRTKPINFDECEHLDACGYFTGAFLIQSEFKGMDVESWIEFVKSKMKSGTP